MNKKFVICASDYDPDSGGVVCLHALAHTLRQLGIDAYLAPMLDEPAKNLRRGFRGLKLRYTNLFFQGKIFSGCLAPWVNIIEASRLAKQGAVFIYPEMILDNPYEAKHVVRWLLHYPMFWKKKIAWNYGDIIIRFNDAVPEQQVSGINFVTDFLKVVKYPIDTYQDDGTTQREGSAYLVRKGEGKIFIHPEDAICVDGLSHSETAEILKRVKTFYSYDLYTAYSLFAVVAGCDSIVVPDDNITLENWYPSEADRFGLAYGVEQLEWARKTTPKVLERLHSEESKNRKNVEKFIEILKPLLADQPQKDIVSPKDTNE